MRLRTKFQDKDFELGEVVDAQIAYACLQRMKIEAKDKEGEFHSFYYDSIKDFTDHWEDASEEPEEHYFISNCGEVKPEKGHSLHRDQRIKIGNDFESKEEAEAAVDRLKAWKRLRDKGFEFDGWKRDERYYGDFTITATDQISCDDKDLELLFGGEE